MTRANGTEETNRHRNGSANTHDTPPNPDTSEAASPSPLPLLPPVEISPLTIAEKRLLLAHIVRLNLLDCLDDSGAFDLARARRTLPACAVQELIIDETTRTDRQGNTTTRRKIRVRLVDKLRAIKLDDHLERAAEIENRKRAAEKAGRPLPICEKTGRILTQGEAFRRALERTQRQEQEQADQRAEQEHQPATSPTPSPLPTPTQNEEPRIHQPNPASSSPYLSSSSHSSYPSPTKNEEPTPHPQPAPSSSSSTPCSPPQAPCLLTIDAYNASILATAASTSPKSPTFTPAHTSFTQLRTRNQETSKPRPKPTAPPLPHRKNTVEHIDLTPLSANPKYPNLSAIPTSPSPHPP